MNNKYIFSLRSDLGLKFIVKETRSFLLFSILSTAGFIISLLLDNTIILKLLLVTIASLTLLPSLSLINELRKLGRIKSLAFDGKEWIISVTDGAEIRSIPSLFIYSIHVDVTGHFDLVALINKRKFHLHPMLFENPEEFRLFIRNQYEITPAEKVNPANQPK